MKSLFTLLALFFCFSGLTQPVYTFTGNGNWSDSANWSNRQVPPDILPSGSRVFIAPAPNGECVVDVPVYVTRSSTFSQQTGSKLRILNDLVLDNVSDSFNLTDYDIQYLDGIAASNPAEIILAPRVAGTGEGLQQVQDARNALILSMLSHARDLSAEKQQIFPAGPSGSVPNQPAHYGYAYRFGGNADDKDISTRRIADHCDEAHAADAVKGTDATGLVINLLRHAGVTMPLSAAGQFPLVLSWALSSSVNATYNRVRLDSLGFLSQSSFMNGDMIIWPSQQHMGILYADAGQWKVFNSNGNPFTNTQPGCRIPDPGNSNNCLQLRTPEEEQGLNLGQARGIHPIKFTNAIDLATDAWGTGYRLYRFETVGLTTATVINITGTSARSGGTVTYAGSNQIAARGICWSTRPNPVIDNNPLKTIDGNVTGAYGSNLNNLDTNKTYFVRSYVTIRNSPSDKGVTYYGNQVEFKTSALPTLNTAEITDITLTSAVSGGNIINDGRSNITVRGVCWSTEHNPTIDLATRTVNGTGIGSFVSNITGLSANTIYYVRAYAVNEVGVAYGNERSFAATFIIPPFVSTLPVTDITRSTAVSGGNVSYDGGSPVTQRGVCWSTFPQPTDLLSTKTQDGSGLGNFASNITGLTENTLYYVRAYAINAVGPGFGEEITFTTPGLPSVTTAPISNIGLSSAVSGGDVTDDGRSPVTARGICWSTSPNPTISSFGKTTNGSGIGGFVSNMSGLAERTMYYVRAYATNAVGTAYGNERMFTTLALPTVSTTPLSQVTLTTALSGGNITDDGGSPVLQRGVCWSTTNPPTIALSTKTIDGSGSGTFTSNITGLSNVTYYIRAYATTSAGTAYGITYIKPPASIPTVSTTQFSQATLTTAVSGGNVTNDGGSPVLQRGVCWSSTNVPTVAVSTKTVDGSGVGIFTSNITGLSNVTYYIRAYATNAVGTAYGIALLKPPASLPTVTTTLPSQITANSAVSGGSITNNGGIPVTARGVCWSTSDNPTVALSTKTVDSGSGTTFISNVSGLSTNTVYKVRAYATNELGTAYGEQFCFTASEEGFFTDIRDGQQYPYKRLGTQVWMTKNLNYAATGSWCLFDSASRCSQFGRLYNWNSAVTVAPTGWHLPSDAEWTTLINFLGGESVAGGTMKSTSSLWANINYGATNCSGWSGLPGGLRDENGLFSSPGGVGAWWSSSESFTGYAWYRYIYFSNTIAVRANPPKATGVYVRCIRD